MDLPAVASAVSPRAVSVPPASKAPSALDPSRARWGAGSIVSIVLALAVFVVLSVWLTPWWLVLPVVIFLVIWLVNDRGQAMRAVNAARADPVRHRAVLDHIAAAAARMEIAPPEVYVSPQPVRNAFAISDRNGGAVCVFQGTLDALSDDELAAVLAHEVGHIKNRDSLYVVLFQSLRISLTVVLVFLAIVCALAISFLTRGRGGALAGVFGAGMLIVGAAASYLMVTAGLRSREYGADRLAAATHPDPMALGRALNRLQESGHQWQVGDVPVTVAARCIVPPFASSFVSELVASHPSTERRIARIEKLLGASRVAELERRNTDARSTAEVAARQRALLFARTASPRPLSGDEPFIALADEALWASGVAKIVTVKSVEGRQGFEIGESGTVFVTTHRVLFVGLTGRTEWRWSKLHDRTWVDQTAGGELLVLAVEDRRRNSGVWVESVFSPELRSVVDVAIAHHNGDRNGLVARLEAAVQEVSAE